GYEKHRWLVFDEGGELLFVPKQVWLALVEFLPQEEADRWREDQLIWTTAVHWDDEIRARELCFSGQDEIIPILRRYFESFDYSPYTPGPRE
ncbi:MAG: hypothetical protein ACRDRL_07765, partial [Sciscionella sp.]